MHRDMYSVGSTQSQTGSFEIQQADCLQGLCLQAAGQGCTAPDRVARAPLHMMWVPGSWVRAFSYSWAGVRLWYTVAPLRPASDMEASKRCVWVRLGDGGTAWTQVFVRLWGPNETSETCLAFCSSMLLAGKARAMEPCRQLHETQLTPPCTQQQIGTSRTLSPL